MARRHRKIAAVVTLSIIVGVFASVYFVVSSRTFQTGVINALAAGGDYKLDFVNLRFRWLPTGISINKVKALNESTGNSFSADSINIRINPLGLLRGRLVISHFTVEGFEADILKWPVPKEKRERFNIKKLLILKNIEIDEGLLQGAKFTFPDKSALFADTLIFRFQPRLLSDIGLSLNLQGVSHNKSYIGSLTLEGKTNFANWPDVKGRIGVKDMKLDDYSISSLSANANFKDSNMELSDFELVSGGKTFGGKFSLNLTTKDYKAELKIPEPLPVPGLGSVPSQPAPSGVEGSRGSENPTIDTSGLVSGEILINGNGFELNKNAGSAKIDLTHAKEGLEPVRLTSFLSWKNSVVTINDSKLTIKDGEIALDGLVNVPAKNIDINFDIKNVPLESVFGRFGDKNFHPISGIADGTADCKGWLKDFKITGDAHTTGPGGYYQIVTDYAHATVVATYNELNLNGEIEQDNKKTGDVALKIKYGAKIPGHVRPKNIHLEANVYNNDLSQSMAAYKLSGIGNGHLIMDGPQRSYNGKIDATIENGSFADIVFQKVSVNSEMTYKKIKFTNGELIFPNMQPVVFSQPIMMDFEDAGVHFYGHPVEAVAFDAALNSKTGAWKIKKLDYHDLTVSGIYEPKGSSDLAINGMIEGKNLSAFKAYLREAAGPINFKLKIAGPTTNPSVSGNITFSDNTIYPRKWNQRMENLTGELKFNGHTISTETLTGTVEDGGFEVRGFIQHENLQPQKFDVFYAGENLRFSHPNRTFRMEYNAGLHWSGTASSSSLSGELTVLDGKYTKDFVLIGDLSASPVEDKSEGIFNDPSVRLDLKINNTGDLAIRNNIGDIWLKADLTAKGTAARPEITGIIEAQEGKIHYINRDFNITQGFIEFHDPYTNPYLEITAEHEVPTITDLVIIATLHGRINNLTLDLSATKPMERRDIVSLLLFGVTEQEMRDTQLSMGLAPSVVASQVTHMIERPVSKFTHLDIFRLEAASTDTGAGSTSPQSQISRIYLGKQLTDRLSIEFKTDINTEDAQQTLYAEYLLTDFLILKGERATGQKYKLNMSLRFKER